MNVKIFLVIVGNLLILGNSRIVEITTNNIHLVIRSVGQLTLLLNNPNCPHSHAYAQKYLKIQTQKTIGITDCSKDNHICEYLNATHFPTLLLLSNGAVSVINQHDYLHQHKAIQADSSQLILQDVLQYLKDDRKWVAIVLQEEQLPTIDRLDNHKDRRVFYISNPSRLHKALFQMVGHQLGCWIIVNQNSTFHRHYCGNGYKSQELDKHLNNFINHKLDRHIFTKEVSKNYLEQRVLQQIVSDLGRKQSNCRLVYFYSRHCEHCSLEDVENIRTLSSQYRAYQNHDIQIFNLDSEEFPRGFTLRRVPELVEFCNAKARVFGNIFTLKALRSFLSPQIVPQTESSPSQL